MLENRIKQFIEENADEKKAEFDKKLVSTNYDIKGIMTKPLEDFAKALAREGVKVYEMPKNCHEEILLAGMVLAHSKIGSDEKIESLKHLLPFIDNWATCDMIVARFKKLENKKDFFISLLDSENTYYVRVGIVWLMRFALKGDLQNIVKLLNDKVKNREYYVEMALAWCYAEAFIYDFDFMYEFLKSVESRFVQLKSISKACESFRISDENKAELKNLRNVLKAKE